MDGEELVVITQSAQQQCGHFLQPSMSIRFTHLACSPPASHVMLFSLSVCVCVLACLLNFGYKVNEAK